MNEENAVDVQANISFVERTELMVNQVEQYGGVLLGSVLIIIIGVVAIYLVHRIASKHVFPHLGKGRILKVTGFTLYALIMIGVALVVLSAMGFEVEAVSHFAITAIFLGALFFYFLLPFLPKLPFHIGHLVEVENERGTVTALSPLFTVLEKYDGTLIFIPNMSIFSQVIKNYSRVSSRRIDIHLKVRNEYDLERTKKILLKMMSADERVLEEPQPPFLRVMEANALLIDLRASCWVRNDDYFNTKCDFWEKIVTIFKEDIHLAPPYLEFYGDS